MKKFCVIVCTIVCAATLMAGPHGRGGGRHHHHHGGGGSSGVRLATDIVNLVGAGLDLINPPAPVYGPGPVVVMPPAAPPVVAAPPPRVTYVPTGMIGIDGRPVYQRVVVPDNVTYVTGPPEPGAVVIPANPTTPTVYVR